MTCASCVGRVEKALLKVPGVLGAAVNLAHRAGRRPGAGDGAGRRAAGGGRARPATPQRDASRQPAEQPAQRAARLVAGGAGAALTLPLVLPMLLQLFGIDWMLAGWVQLALATPVQFWLGARFYRAGWKALRAGSRQHGPAGRARHLGGLRPVGLPAARATPATACRTCTSRPRPRSSRWCCWASGSRARAKRQTTDAIRALNALRPATARVLPRRRRGRDAGRRRCASATWSSCAPASASPSTARSIEGRSHVDESLITGESLPVAKARGRPA